MIKWQSIRSSLLSFSDHHSHRRFRFGGCCCLMASASSLFQARNDPLPFILSTPSPSQQYHHASPNLVERFPCLSVGKSWIDSTLNRRSVNGLSLHNHNQNHNHNHNNAFRNPFGPSLARDSEIGIEDNCNAARLENGRRYHLGFPDQSVPPKIVVAVDVDEVLGNFMSALNRFIADRYSLNHSLSEYHVYEFFKIWNCSRDEADIRVHEFFKTSYFKTGIHPIPGAQQALRKLSRFCNLSVVTSRQNAIRDHTIEWIEKHYPGLFQEVHFGNHFALEGQSRPKSDICRSLGAKVLIDDNPRYAIECAEVGIRVLLFDYENSYPWCKIEAVNQHPLVTKVNSWEDVEHQLMSWIAS